MTTIVVYDRHNSKCLETEIESITTVQNIKQQICNKDPDSIQILHNGMLLPDSTLLSSLGERIILIVESDIEFRNIEENEPKREDNNKIGDVKLCGSSQDEFIYILLHGNRRRVKRNEVFFKAGKPYYITDRKRPTNIKNIVDMVQESVQHYLTPQFAIQLLLLSVILFTNNLFVLFFIIAVRSLRAISKLVLEWRIWQLAESKVSRIVFMYVASMFLVDHPLFR